MVTRRVGDGLLAVLAWAVAFSPSLAEDLPADLPPLHTAAALGKVDKLQELLRGGADVNQPAPVAVRFVAQGLHSPIANEVPKGSTPLHFATAFSRREAVRALLAAKA